MRSRTRRVFFPLCAAFGLACFVVFSPTPVPAQSEENKLALKNGTAAKKFAEVKGWKGFWEINITGNPSNVMPGLTVNEASRDSSSYGTFDLARESGSDPADGYFAWKGAGQTRASHHLTRTEWRTDGSGFETSAEGRGIIAFNHILFSINLRTDSAAFHMGNAEDTIAGKREGYSLTRRFDHDQQQYVLDYLNLGKEIRLNADPPNLHHIVNDIWTWVDLFPQVERGPATITVNIAYPSDNATEGTTQAMQATERMTLIPIYDDLECEVTIKNYASWRPRGSIDNPAAPGNGLIARAVLRSKSGDDKDLPQVASYRFELIDTSREPGVCMNWPLGAKDSDFDLRIVNFPRANPQAAIENFLKTWDISSDGFENVPVGILPSLSLPSVTADGQKGEVLLPSKDSSGRPFADIALQSFDFGARSELRVTCVLKDGREITGLIKTEGGRQDLVRLPKRAGADWIAEQWLRENGVASRPGSDDNEKIEGQPLHGDGYTLYEEYRGWVVDGKHVEGDPEKKDFFVLNDIGPDAEGGIALFERESQLRVHGRLTREEMSSDTRLMNGNHRDAPHRVDQHGVWMFSAWGTGIPDAGTTGMTPTDAARAFRPGRVRYVTVEPKKLSQSAFSQAAGVSRYNLSARDASFAYDRAVAHELLHSVGVDHHGEGEERTTFYFQSASDPNNPAGRAGFTTSLPHVTAEDLQRPPGYVHTGRELQRAPLITLLWEDTGQDVAEELAPLFEAALAAERARAATAGASEDAGTRSTAYPGYGKSAAYWRESAAYDHISYIDPRFEIPITISQPGQADSGHELCLMRYYFANAYPVKGLERAYYLVRPGANVAGRMLCRAPDGTGANAPSHKPQPRFGDSAAGRGDCFSQICPNDAHPPRKI